jgi:5'-3' exonuclease
MAVKKFQGWLRKNYSNLVSETLGKLIADLKVRRLFFDLNALVHAAVTEVYETKDVSVQAQIKKDPSSFWKKTISTLCDELVTVILMVRPYYLVYLAADGAVSKAKILQQRQRTYRHAPGSGLFNRNNIKPGTEFMSYLSMELRIMLVQKMNNLESIIEELVKQHDSIKEEDRTKEMTETVQALRASKYNGPGEIKFSDSCQKGEGEHKIIKEMREGRPVKPASDFSRMIDVIFSPDVFGWKADRESSSHETSA